jgi:sulfur-oxidizing protein SoxA
MMHRRGWRAAARVGGFALVAVASAAFGQGSTTDEIEKYRQALQDGNPAELWEARGEALWKQARGPKSVSLEKCDLGLGPGVVKGAYAQMPRYFADADRVMDLETRLVWCMVNLQGFSEADARKNPFGDGANRKSDIEALVAYVTGESRGVKMNVSLDHPRMKEMYALGEQIFFFRGGPHDFACATCHGEDGKRIRLQDLPNLLKTEGAQKAYTTWPAYRVSQGELRSFQWRLYDCFRQQRFPELAFTSDASIALTTFLARNANGAPFNAPAIKR